MSLMCLFTYGISWLSCFYLLPCWFDFCCYLEGGHDVYLLKKLNVCHAIVVLEKAPESPLDYQEIKPANPKGNQPGIIIGRTDAEAESLILWPTDEKSQLFRKGPDAGRLKAGGKRYDRGWDGGTASLIQWTWVWANSGSWWRTGKPGMLQSTGSQRLRHNWATEQQQPNNKIQTM